MPKPAAVIGAADAIVVLGCALRGDAASPALVRRVACGVALLRDGAAPRLLLSGGGDGARPEAEAMRDIALSEGAPEAALILEPLSRNTFENAVESARLLPALGVATVILVSDRYHLPRARLQFRRAGLTVVGTRSPPPRALHQELPLYLRETAAWLVMVVRMLGDVIDRRPAKPR